MAHRTAMPVPMWEHHPMEGSNPLLPDAAAVILKLVARAAEPLTASHLAGQLSGPFRTARGDLADRLDDLVRRGRLHRWPPRTARSNPRFWHRGIEEEVEAVLPGVLAAGPLTRIQIDETLRRRLFGLPRQRVAALRAEALATQLSAGNAFEHPPRGRYPARFGCQPPDPRDYLAATRRELEKVFRRLTRVGVGRETILGALDGLIGDSAGADTRREKREEHSDAWPPLLRAMEAVEPAARNQALVSIPALRRAMGLSKGRFDELIMAMAERGRLFLHEHIYPGQLSDAEREQLVNDGQGGYVMGVVWREDGGDD